MEKILVVKTSSLGDIIHCFPAVSLLRELNPNAQIDWLVNKSLDSVASLHPGINNTIIFDRSGLSDPLKFPSAFFSLRKSLRAAKYDLVIDFQGLLRNAFFSRCSGAKSVVGFDPPPERASKFFYDKAIPTAGVIHAVEKNCALVCGIFKKDKSIPQFEVKEDRFATNSLQNILEINTVPKTKPLLVVAPGARWKSKKWPTDFFSSTLKILRESFPELVFVLAGSTDDTGDCSKIVNSGIKHPIVNLAGKTNLRELFELIRLAKAVLCVDSGPMHIAAALSVPVFALFGPTDPEKTGPYGKGHKVFQSGTCIKCFKRYCSRASEICHEALSPSLVSESIKKKLERSKT